MADIAPVGTTLYRRRQEVSVHCPLCQQEETNTHIWTCPHEGIRTIFMWGYEKIFHMLYKGPQTILTLFQHTFYEL
jgi:hypothetical protein